ncbi:DNA topoisomerase III [Pectobacterium punjabense]|uniref:DNA topoisomerase n=1 Tax=Pectobacterium punjabense TaxID=2108399 RepID=A0ABX6KYW0_9GAMM|nr:MULTISPECIES: DNA topoisomerase III [Pectobacterium]MBA0211961.1 DNA topoisomerase III [Pectobacterium brasiliense]MBS4431001.1 DNA topoisomerase III [Pectobacterium punjabense]PTA65564.1 DNA topoisomerase III [Pectobacterium punjabense]QJA19273.1 DNA topoisomerase III [Pectobacterium punjabense]
MRLFICEKPSQARDIAAVLGATKRGQGFLSAPGITITWARGHLLETASPEVYGTQFEKPWRIDVLPVLPPVWQMVVKSESSDQFTVISRLLKQVDEVVISTDADREGEVIGWSLLEYCGWRGPVFRLWLSALDESSIRAALAAIKPGSETKPLYYAGLGRSRADWLIGMNLTRLYTVKARDKGYDGLLSVGRVQTPVLAMVVNREREIATFVPKPYWQVWVALQSNGVRFSAQWVPAKMYVDEEKRCIHQDIAQQVAQLCKQTGKATVIEQETKREKEAAPLAFTMGTLQQACGRLWDMSPQKVLDIAQSLYETHKATSYPRTDCGFLPESMREEIPDVLSALVKIDPSLQALISQLDTRFVSRIWDDKKMTAHHGIIPTRHVCDMSKMSDQEKQVYVLIRRHYLAQFFPLHEVDFTRLSLNIGGQLFQTTGRVVVVPGWKRLFSQQDDGEHKESAADEKDQSLPMLVKGDNGAVTGAEIKALKTKPPQYFTFQSLIAAMMNAAAYVTDLTLKKVLKENAGLGTEATRGGIVETLLARNFIIIKGRYLRATDIAMDLIDALPHALKEPGMTALWEQALDEVAKGKMTLDNFMSRQTQWICQLVSLGAQQDVVVRVPPTPACPLCGSKTRLRKGVKGSFYGCEKYPDCKGMINIPGQGKNTAPKTRKKKQN